jgi:hypothetical protein
MIQWRLNGEPLATPLTAALEYQTTATGAHPLAKAVIAFPFGVFGLISALHDYLQHLVVDVLFP